MFRVSLRFIIHLLVCFVSVQAQNQQDPTLMNGGSILAMAGDNCIAIAVDKRFGSGPQMVNIAPRTILAPHSRLLIGFTVCHIWVYLAVGSDCVPKADYSLF